MFHLTSCFLLFLFNVAFYFSVCLADFYCHKTIIVYNGFENKALTSSKNKKTKDVW